MSTLSCTSCAQRCAKPLKCGRCKVAVYYSAACQKEDWKSHKQMCQPNAGKPAALEPELESAEASPIACKRPTAAVSVEETQQMTEASAAGEVHTTETSGALAPPVINTAADIMQAAGMGAGSSSRQGKVECRACSGPCLKVLKCSVCKNAAYCSAKCQKEDWQFHKRVCKKWKPPVVCWCGSTFKDDTFFCTDCGSRRPDEGEADSDDEVPQETRAAPKASPQAADTPDIDDKEVGNFYRHRDWKPEEKQDFAPTPINVLDKSPKHEMGNRSGSKWNKAGTWEEKSMLQWWKNLLPSLAGHSYGTLTIEAIRDITGDASIVYVRGKPRFFFDLEFWIDISVKSDGGSVAKGYAKVVDVSDELWQDLSVVELSLAGSKLSTIEAKLVPWLKHGLGVCVKQYAAQG